MSTAITSLLPKSFNFTKTKNLGGGSSVGFELSSARTDVAEAIAKDQPFPDGNIDLGQISLRAEGSKDFALDGGSGKVTFSGDAGAYAGLTVLDKSTDVEALLVRDQVSDRIATGLQLAEDATHRYVMLRWGYHLAGAAKGSLGLGAGGSVQFGAEGKRLGAYAIVRRLPSTTGARTAIVQTFDSWMLPTQCNGAESLAPGTLLVTEVDGSVALKIGAQYGYDFSWVREDATLGGLSGDIGLKIQLGISANFGFEASGQYGLMLSRDSLSETDRRIRLRLFRLNRKGLSFAFAAGGSVQASFDQFTPEHFDEFVKSVFGLHDLQVLKDLDQWTDPNKKITDLLADVGVDYSEQFLKAVTGIDPKTSFEQARGRLVAVLEKWHALPHRVTALLQSFISHETGKAATLRSVLRRFKESSAQDFRPELEALLGRADFFKTPFGAWLEAAASKPILTALTNSQEYQTLQNLAAATLGILDGSIVENTLVDLQSELDRRLRLDQLENVVTQTDFDKIDDWLKARLSRFLGKKMEFAEIERIRTAMHRLLALRQTFFQKAKEALSKKYEFQFLYNYQKAATSTALIDAEFDFAASEVTNLLRDAIRGDFNRILSERVDGVTLKQGILTHGIERQSHIEMNLPFASSSLDHINRSLAKVEAIDSERGRILVYDLGAEDLVTARKKFSSRLAINARIVTGSAVRVHSEDSLTHSYLFRQAVPNMRRSHLQYQLKGYLQEYFPNSFGAGEQSFDTWISDLDQTVEESLHNGPDNFGNTLLSLELSGPASTVAAWTKAPKEKSADAYLRMSRIIQTQLKRLIPFCYFQDPSKYKDIVPSAALLLYSSLPPTTKIIVNGDRVERFDQPDGIYWDWVDPAKREAMAKDPHTLAQFLVKLSRIQDLLRNTPSMDSTIPFYAPEQAGSLINTALKTGKTQFESLLFVESEIIREAHEAGQEMGKFFASANSNNPADAVKRLSQFGAKLTDAFNSKIDSIYRGAALRPMGTAIFLEAARAFDPALQSGRPSAILELQILRDKPEFRLPDFLDGKMPAATDVVRPEKFVSLEA